MATVEKRNNGYRITVSAGYDMQGKQIRKRMTWEPAPGMTKKQIEKELERQKVMFEEKVRSGQVLDSSIRFCDFSEYWLAEYAEKQLRPRTVAGYKDMLVRINERLGNIRLDKLMPKDLIQFYNNLSVCGTRRDYRCIAKPELTERLKACGLTRKAVAENSGLGIQTVYEAFKGKYVSKKSAEKIADVLKKPLSSLFDTDETDGKTLSGKTQLHYHRLISSILEKAVKWQVIFSNPCRRVEAPKAEKKEAEYIDEIEAQRLIECLQNEPLQYKAIVMLLLYSGMRRGELCGLEWLILTLPIV